MRPSKGLDYFRNRLTHSIEVAQIAIVMLWHFFSGKQVAIHGSSSSAQRGKQPGQTRAQPHFDRCRLGPSMASLYPGPGARLRTRCCPPSARCRRWSAPTRCWTKLAKASS